MTKRIVSGIFILTALGALGVILAGALTSGEQLIVRFLTAVIVAALGLYVISDLRLQADDDAMTARTSDPTRVDTVDVPPNSTAAFMATVTKRGEKGDEVEGSEEEERSGKRSDDESDLKMPVGALTNGTSSNGTSSNGSAAAAELNGDAIEASGEDDSTDDATETLVIQSDLVSNISVDTDEQGTQDVEVGATASSAAAQPLAAVEAVESDNGSTNGAVVRSVNTKAPATIKAVGLAPPKDVTLIDVMPGQMNGTDRHDEPGEVDVAEVSLSGGDSSTGGTAGIHHDPNADSDITAEMKHSAIFEQALNGSVSDIGHSSEPEQASEKVGEGSGDGLDASDQDDQHDGQETTSVSDFEYSDELQSPQHEWPTPPSKPTEPAAEQPHPFEKASAAYQAEKERLAAKADGKQLPVPAVSAELEVTEYADAPLAPIIDLREVSGQNAGTVDAAINAGEVEVVATLIEQGMLSTEGPISDRDVRTMVYVAFTSNELRKLLLAGGSPDGPNYGLDLGPVELFDENVHAPAPKTLYSGAPRRQPQSQIG